MKTVAVLKAIVRKLACYRAIDRSGLFQAYSYQQRYLKQSRFHDEPLLHYVLIGEARGYRPNAFFDPVHFRSTARTRRFCRYLANPRLWRFACSAQFDPVHYRAQLPPQRQNVQPLIDFWHDGFDADLDPATTFDTTFFKRATSRDIGDKQNFAFMALTGPPLPLNAATLKASQDRFHAAITLEVLKTRDRPARRNLVFVQASGAFDADFLTADRSFDVLLNLYDGFEPTRTDADIITRQTGTKVTAIWKILKERPELLLGYDHVLFLDDDVEIAAVAIETFFEAMRTHDLDLAQPALSARSTTYFEDLKKPRAGEGLSRLTSVEIMMPGVSRRALEQCGWVFGTGISGWAVDFLLGAEVRRTLSTLPALIGWSVAEHLRPFDIENGSFYRFLETHGIRASTEAGAIALSYGIDDSAFAIRAIGDIAVPC